MQCSLFVMLSLRYFLILDSTKRVRDCAIVGRLNFTILCYRRGVLVLQKLGRRFWSCGSDYESDHLDVRSMLVRKFSLSVYAVIY